MASKYHRGPFVWIKRKDGSAFSTKLRHAVPHEMQKALDWLERIKSEETQKFTEPERWEFWAPQYIDERYEDSKKSLDRYKLRWRSIRAFMMRENIPGPRQLTFNVMTKYVAWRRKGDQEYGVWASGKNTAIGDVKFLHLLMERAKQLGYTNSNPCDNLGLKKTKPKEKAEISDEHLQLIWAKLKIEEQWMRDSFLIYLYTGCRLSECAMPLDCVDMERRFIHFPDTKGDKPFTVPLRAELAPLFQRLKRERPGKPAVDLPPPNLASLAWWKFFRRIGLGYSVHCLRVTFISRLARAGVPMSDAMRLVNHASHEIHRIYQRFQPEDLRESLQKLSLPALNTHGPRENPDAPATNPPAPPPK